MRPFPRLHEIDRAKGLVIILVVIGHIVAAEPPAGNAWYMTLKSIIYRFHMPFFMFLCGVVYAYTAPPFSWTTYGRTLWKRAGRLLPSFFFFGIIILLGKSMNALFIQVDRAPTHVAQAILNLLLRPSTSAARSLWFIYALFGFYLLFPIIIAVTRKSATALLALTGFLHFLPYYFPVPSLFVLDRLCEYAVFFAIGVVFVDHYQHWRRYFHKYALHTFLLFLATLPMIFIVEQFWSKSILGLLSIPVIYNLADSPRTDTWLLSILGEYTFSIYLMNTIIIGLGKGVFLKFLSWDGPHFLLFFPLLLTSGLAGPILIQRFILSRHPFTHAMSK